MAIWGVGMDLQLLGMLTTQAMLKAQLSSDVGMLVLRPLAVT